MKHHFATKTFLKTIGKHAIDFYAKNDTTILTATSITTSLMGSVMTYRNAQKIHDVIYGTKVQLSKTPIDDREARKDIYINAAKELSTLMAPIVIFHAISIGCSIGANRVSKKRIATLSAACSVAELAINEYDAFKKEMIEELGKEKVEEVQEKITAERYATVDADPAVAIRPGEWRWIEPYTQHQFSSTTDKVDAAIERCKKAILKNGSVTYTDILYELGIGYKSGAFAKNIIFTKESELDWRPTACPLNENDEAMTLLNFYNSDGPEWLRRAANENAMGDRYSW